MMSDYEKACYDLHNLLNELGNKEPIGYRLHFQLYGESSISVYKTIDSKKSEQIFLIKADDGMECYQRAIHELKDYLRRIK